MPIFLFDTFGLIFRSHHARNRPKPTFHRETAAPTDTAKDFSRRIRQTINCYKPELIAFAWDQKLGKTFRHEIYPAYKSNRREAPDDLAAQIPLIREWLCAMNLAIVEHDRYEADDIIGTLARMAIDGVDEAGKGVVIISADKDLCQLIRPGVRILNPSTQAVLHDAEDVRTAIGVSPDQIVDFLALMGDASDNIPGVAGIGKVQALDLIGRYGSIAGIFANIASLKPSQKLAMEAGREIVATSQRLAAIAADVPLGVAMSDLAAQKPNREELKRLAFEFGW